MKQQPHWDEMSAQNHPLVFNERQRNPYIKGEAAADPKTSLYSERFTPIYLSNKNKIKVKTKQGIQRLEIRRFGQAQKVRWGYSTLA